MSFMSYFCELKMFFWRCKISQNINNNEEERSKKKWRKTVTENYMATLASAIYFPHPQSSVVECFGLHFYGETATAAAALSE